MRPLLLTFLAGFLFVEGKTQSVPGIGDESFLIINTLIKDKRSHIYLYPTIHHESIATIRELIKGGKFKQNIEDENGHDISESIVLTKQELDSLLLQLDACKTFRWTSQDLSRIQLDRLTLITGDSTQKLYDVTIKYHILPPLFIRNGRYCIFYYDYCCGGLCGEGHLVIYKREGNEWKRWWGLYGWVS